MIDIRNLPYYESFWHMCPYQVSPEVQNHQQWKCLLSLMELTPKYTKEHMFILIYCMNSVHNAGSVFLWNDIKC